jgi:hypothetical protein
VAARRRVERDVRFVDAAPEVNPQVDAAYRLKYDRYGPQIVGTGVGPARPRSPSAFGHRRRLTVLMVPPFTLINRGGDAGTLHEEWVNIA